MKPVLVLAGVALASAYAITSDARADALAGFGSGFGPAAPAAGTLADLIFDSDFDGQDNGATSCAEATVLGGDTTYSADTTAAPNWISSFGPVFSPAHDVVYAFVAGPDVQGSITPTSADFTFAMYLIPSCAGSGVEPPPIGATATIGSGIDLEASGVTSGNTYYLAITGASFGGGGANGTVNFTTPPSLGIAPRVVR